MCTKFVILKKYKSEVHTICFNYKLLIFKNNYNKTCDDYTNITLVNYDLWKKITSTYYEHYTKVISESYEYIQNITKLKKRDWKNWRGPSNLMKNGEIPLFTVAFWFPDLEIAIFGITQKYQGFPYVNTIESEFRKISWFV